MDVKRKADKIFSAEAQQTVLRWERKRFQTSNTRYEMRKSVFYKSVSDVCRRGKFPSVKPIPCHAIANRRREYRLGKGNESHQSMDTMKPLLRKLYFWAVPAQGGNEIARVKMENSSPHRVRYLTNERQLFRD